MRTGSKPDTEVIIAGGRLAGCTLASLLSNAGINCLVIDASEPRLNESGHVLDPRALAITRCSRNILHSAGVWQAIDRNCIGVFRKMQVWDEAGSGTIHFNSAELCEPALGYIIVQPVLEEVLKENIKQSTHVKYYQPARIVSLQRRDQIITAGLKDGRQLSAKLIIAADGMHSTIRKLADISFSEHDYRQKAIACIVKTEKSHGESARQRFLKNGPLAFLPLADPHECGVVWSTLPEYADELLLMDEQQFNKRLTDAFNNNAGSVLSSRDRAVFSLRHAQAGQYCQERIALIGEAAHIVHPLAGQGANLGFLDAAALAEVILGARQKQRDIGSYTILRRYERWRKGENELMLRLLQGFKYLFESQTEPARLLRNFGLDLTNAMTPLKHMIMRRAMGLSGELPVYALTAD